MAVHLAMQNGFPAKYDIEESVGLNLFSVPDGSELRETKYYDAQLRKILEKLYEETKTLLVEHRKLLILFAIDCLTIKF